MDFLFSSSLYDEQKLVNICNLFKNESTLRMLPPQVMMNILNALDKFHKPSIFKYFASNFGLQVLPKCEINNNPIHQHHQSLISRAPFNGNFSNQHQSTTINYQPIALPTMPRPVDLQPPNRFNRLNTAACNSSSDLSDSRRLSQMNGVSSQVPIIPLSPVHK